MIAKIIIGFLAIIGAADMLIAVIIETFPKSKATKFLFKNCSVKFNTETYEKIE